MPDALPRWSFFTHQRTLTSASRALAMVDGMRMRNKINRVVSLADLQIIQREMGRLALKQDEAGALRGAFEAFENLISCRDELGAFRQDIPINIPSSMPHPTADQRRRLYNFTKAFFDSCYTTILHLLSVTARFSGVFGQVSLAEIAPFIKTLEEATWGLIHHLGIAELEQARLFRAILNHPQQFPVIDWSTQTV